MGLPSGIKQSKVCWWHQTASGGCHPRGLGHGPTVHKAPVAEAPTSLLPKGLPEVSSQGTQPLSSRVAQLLFSTSHLLLSPVHISDSNIIWIIRNSSTQTQGSQCHDFTKFCNAVKLVWTWDVQHSIQTLRNFLFIPWSHKLRNILQLHYFVIFPRWLQDLPFLPLGWPFCCSWSYVLFCVPASECHWFANLPQPEKPVNDLATNSECKGVGNKKWNTGNAYQVRKISSLGWQVLKNNEAIMD